MNKKTLLVIGCILFSSIVLADNVDEYVESLLKKEKIPGMSLVIMKDGKIVKTRGYGFSNLEHQVPAKPETIYQSGSVGKQFTAAAVMLLVEDRKVQLDDPITKYFKESPKSWKGITVRHLLTHTSGIPDYTEKDIDYRRDYTEDELLKVLKKLDLEFKPGEKWNYSNSGYMLLGFLIRKVSGEFYGDLLEERIFTPLGMDTAQVISEADIVPNRAAGYQLEKDQLKNQTWVAPSINTTADGALYLTALDMARWAEALYGDRVLKTESLKNIWTPVRLNNGSSYPYGFGWRLGYQRGHLVISHSGHWQGFSTAISRHPDFGLTVIILANLADVSTLDIVEEIAGIYEPALQSARRLNPAGTGEPVLAEQLKKMLLELSQNKQTPVLLPAFADTLTKDQNQKIGEVVSDMKTFDFLACDQIQGEPMEFFGGEPTQYCYYRITTSSASRLLTAGITKEGKVNEFSLLAYTPSVTGE